MGNGGFLFYGDRVLVLQDEKVLEIDGGDACKIMYYSQ